MNYIIRNKSLLTGKDNLEHLYTFKDFPVFMGCVDTPRAKDIVADMIWDICRNTGFIQLRKLIPLEILYLGQHNDGTGQVWQDHYQQFAEFIYKNKAGKNILEIGGAHDIIANNYLKLQPETRWTIVEPHPEQIKNKKIKVIKGWFDDKFVFDKEVETIVHSHVFEHVFEPLKFMEHLSNWLQVGQKNIFTFPNFLPMLEKKQTNCLNFEHSTFLTEYFADYILRKFGFRIIDKKYYGDPHSIFYATEKVSVPKEEPLVDNKYKEYKKVFLDFINYHLALVADLNEKINSSHNQTYLFGAHIFSQYLLQFGLDGSKIIKVLDNSPLKIDKRLYGTSLAVASPKILKDKGKVNVILKAGIYNEEIKKDILENINDQVSFW